MTSSSLARIALATLILGGGVTLAIPSASVAAGAAVGPKRLSLVLPLAGDRSGLRAFALAVSTPGSPDYHHYLTVPELARRFGASEQSRRRVERALRARGARSVSIDPTGQFAAASIDAVRGRRDFASIPRSLRGVVTGVVGLRGARQAPGNTGPGSQPVTSSGSRRTGTPAGCAAAIGSGGFTPNQYLTAYGFDPLRAEGDTGQGERVAVIEEDGFRRSDIATFGHCFGLPVPPIVVHPVGNVGVAPASGEATLDLEMVDAGAPGLQAIDVYESGGSVATTVSEFAAPLKPSAPRPAVISSSLGLCEHQTVEELGDVGIATIERVLQTAAAAGITTVVASGDNGSSDCTDERGVSTDRLAVDYPGSSPWVTSVGGTNVVLSPANAVQSQVVWNGAGARPGESGGGGASELFARPSYQPAGLGALRTVPDVSLLADTRPGYAAYCSSRECVAGDNPRWAETGGTSAAAPLLAAGVALIDERASASGRPAVGLLNPLLYQLGSDTTLAPTIFNDVVTGTNDVGQFVPTIGRPFGCCSAQPGYDEATGWGSINVSALADQVTGGG